jgi:hypothetical protein
MKLHQHGNVFSPLPQWRHLQGEHGVLHAAITDAVHGSIAFFGNAGSRMNDMRGCFHALRGGVGGFGS